MNLSLRVALLLSGFAFTSPLGAFALPLNSTEVRDLGSSSRAAANCFPALGFTMPANVPASLNDWWCDPHTEYAFVGFSYEVTECQSAATLKNDFMNIRKKFNGRYVRLYGACDRSGFYNDIVEAAWHAGVGVQALIWFGFHGDNKWMKRRDDLFSILHSNPKAKFVTRAVQFGSETLYDHALNPETLIAQIKSAKEQLASLHISVTVSDLAYSFRYLYGAEGAKVLKAVDCIDAHILPFFSASASRAINSWPLVKKDLDYFVSEAQGKKIWFSQNGWPSKTSSGVQPNSPNAVANVQNERDYYSLLDDHCADFKAVPGGGVGWFAHIYSDSQEPGYGIYDASDTSLKFPFAPRTSC